MQRLQSIKNEIERVNLEIQSAERDYDLNRAAELKYGTVLQLQKQLKEAEEALEKEAVSPCMPCVLTGWRPVRLELFCIGPGPRSSWQVKQQWRRRAATALPPLLGVLML